MAFGAVLFCIDIMNASLEGMNQPLVGFLFEARATFLDVSLQLGTELLNRVEISGGR
jgi:hypothetical protein